MTSEGTVQCQARRIEERGRGRGEARGESWAWPAPVGLGGHAVELFFVLVLILWWAE